MSDDKIPAIHPDFPRWYRTVDVEENRERLHRTWKGVASLGMAANRGDVETMIRIVFRSRQAASAGCIARVRQFFRDADEFFDAQDNARELEVLCGSTLAFLMQQGRSLAARSALAVTTSALGGARPLDLPMD